MELVPEGQRGGLGNRQQANNKHSVCRKERAVEIHKTGKGFRSLGEGPLGSSVS